ncbi:MAG: ABC transporter ATP-binding protein [Clostridia bacterium]|nr:ABC transporter ATP-binding protein [Clostridia bacterium]
MIRFENVSVSYEKATAPVLDSLSFEIGAGESVGLIGANGAGKSTLLKTLTGLLPYDGSITVCDLPLIKENLAGIRRKTGYVMQNSDNQLFMPKVIDDMVFGPVNYGESRENAEKSADEALAKLGAEYLKERYNHKISGGEKRLAAIATVLAMKPEIMLFDEPSSALDPKNRRALISILNLLPETKIIATHDLDLVLDTCEKVILLNGGRIAAQGKARDILKDKELLEKNNLELPLSLMPRGEI